MIARSGGTTGRHNFRFAPSPPSSTTGSERHAGPPRMMKSLDALALGTSERGPAEQRTDPSTLRVTEIAPDDRIVAFDAVGLWQYRDLLRVLILRDLKVLYRQTAM